MPSIALFRSRSPSRPGFLRRFGQARQGAAAVEFAMVGVPFLALVFGLFELGMMFLVSTTLESSAQVAARTLRTGQFQGAGGTAQGYKDAVCANLGWLAQDCKANLYVDVRTFQTFAQVQAPWPVTNGVIDPSQLTFQTTSGCSIVLVRAFYSWSLLAPDLSGIAHLSGNKVLLSSAAAFRNEPFAGQTCA
jgi:Flp pilus assembly protein TadG